MFAYVNGYSGQTIYDDFYITCYNMVFTALPLLIKGFFEQDVNYITDGQQLKQYMPKLYYLGQRSLIFNWPNYFTWYATGIAHSLIIFLIPYWTF
jgi:magnesium-transporting ATPase (P-type)